MNFTDKDSNKSYLNLQQKGFVNKHDTCMLIQVYLHYLICLCTKKIYIIVSYQILLKLNYVDEYIPTSTHVVRNHTHHIPFLSLSSPKSKSHKMIKSHETKQYSKSNKLHSHDIKLLYNHRFQWFLNFKIDFTNFNDWWIDKWKSTTPFTFNFTSAVIMRWLIVITTR